MHSQAIQAIDVHGHVGTYKGALSPLLDRLMSGGPDVILRRARLAHTRLTIVSGLAALLPRRRSNAVAGNPYTVWLVEGVKGLAFWVVVDPLKPATYAQAKRLLKHPQCMGIKIHPVEHGYPIRQYGRKLFAFAEQHGAVMISHSGEPSCMPADFMTLADAFPRVKFIMAHLGFGLDGDVTHQVRAIQQCRHGNLYSDTSSGREVTSNLLEWAVSEIGADRILFGTDTPLYYSPMFRARIDLADLSLAAKRKILCGNAEKLFGLKVRR